MCLILVAWRTHREYPCVIAANRVNSSNGEFGGTLVPDAPTFSRDAIWSAGDLARITRPGGLPADQLPGTQPATADAPSRGLLVAAS